MGGMPETVTMTGGNVAHEGENFGDEDDMIFVNMEFSNKRFALLEWGSAYRWGEHYVLIQGTKGAIRLDLFNCKGTLKLDGQESYFLIHESQEEDDDRHRKRQFLVPFDLAAVELVERIFGLRFVEREHRPGVACG